MDQGFVDRLVRARDMADMTQHEAADASGTSRTMISRYETGESEPGRKALLALSRAYGVNPTWLLTGEGPKRWSWDGLGQGEHERIVHAMRVVGGWLLAAADSDLDVVGIVERGRAEAEEVAGEDRRDTRASREDAS